MKKRPQAGKLYKMSEHIVLHTINEHCVIMGMKSISEE